MEGSFSFSCVFSSNNFIPQATGPLRKVTIAGNLKYRDGELGGHLTFQGRDTASYGLTVAGNSASTWSATLVSQRLQTVPIVSWHSQAHPSGSQVEIKGQLEVNVRELAPFIALLVPIGPDPGKVTGALEMNWTGTAASEATLTSLWRDSRTHLDGTVRLNGTLPALKGVARDITVDYTGTFTGNAMQIGWTLAPGVLMSATVRAQPRIIPDAVLMMLPPDWARITVPTRVVNSTMIGGITLGRMWRQSPYLTLASCHTREPIKKVYADKGYHGEPNRSFLHLNEIEDGIMRKDTRGAKISKGD